MTSAVGPTAFYILTFLLRSRDTLVGRPQRNALFGRAAELAARCERVSSPHLKCMQQ
jgi:hypothetical protein